MSDVTKPVILDETGQISNQQIESISDQIDLDRETMAAQMTVLGDKITGSAEAVTQSIDGLSPYIQAIREAVDRLDIVYYAE